MLDWDDYYQMQRAKGRRVEISDALSAYKSEHEAFAKDWERSAATPGGVTGSSVWWGSEAKAADGAEG